MNPDNPVHVVSDAPHHAHPGEPHMHEKGQMSPLNLDAVRRELENAHRELDAAYQEHRQAHDAYQKSPGPETQTRMDRAHQKLDQAQEAHNQAHQRAAGA